jgi:hypothetical protein
MRTAWARGAASAGSLLALLGLGSCALVFNYGDYKDAPGGGTGGSATGSGATGGGATGCSETGDAGAGGGTGSAGGATGESMQPVSAWSRRYGDDADQVLGGLSLDAADHVLLTGKYQGTFELATDKKLTTDQPIFDEFIAEFDSFGTPVSLSSTSGMTGEQAGLGIVRDSQGRTVVSKTLLPIPQGFVGGSLLRLEPATLGWSAGIGAVNADNAAVGVAVDTSDNVYAVWQLEESTVVGDQAVTNQGGKDILLVKYMPDSTCIGNMDKVAWSVSLGGQLDDVPTGIAVSREGVFITGEYRGRPNALPQKLPEELPDGGSNGSIFVMKVDLSGKIVWCKVFPSQGTGSARGAAIAVGHDGNPWITGTVTGAVHDQHGLLTLTSNGNSPDVFLMQLNGKDGKTLSATPYGDAGRQDGTGIAVAEDGSIFVTGTFSGKLNFTSYPTYELSAEGTQSIFLLQLNAMGLYTWSKSYGAGRMNELQDVRVAAGKATLAIAGTWRGDLDFGQGLLPALQAESLDVFVAGFSL